MGLTFTPEAPGVMSESVWAISYRLGRPRRVCGLSVAVLGVSRLCAGGIVTGSPDERLGSAAPGCL